MPLALAPLLVFLAYDAAFFKFTQKAGQQMEKNIVEME